MLVNDEFVRQYLIKGNCVFLRYIHVSAKLSGHPCVMVMLGLVNVGK